MAKFCVQKKGFTLVEMLVTLTILAILAAAIMPLAKIAVKRQKEIELRRNLRIIREAIDVYKKLADENKIDVEDDSEGYPPDLDTLVKGVELKAGEGKDESTKIVKFLRRIPKDPMTNSYDWGLRSYQDDHDSDVWGGENVYDVYTKSLGTALDGTKYRDW
ncbi:MAG: type II secretion system protein [Candidatus Aminicenantes bacterium]|nr:MAG: type II secretion system protein [Candidatus Aminicenantes bacterium]